MRCGRVRGELTRGTVCASTSGRQPTFRRCATALALSFLLLSPVPVASGQGGGNKFPTVETFSNTAASMNEGSTDALTGTIGDRNGEADLEAVAMLTVTGPVVSSERLITAADLSQATEPVSFDAAGWKVWNPTSNDQLLSFSFQYAYPALTAATYVWRATVNDGRPYQNGPAADVTVNVLMRITTATDPVLPTGSSAPGAAWGNWAADPGGADVEGVNFIKITNSGTSAAQSFTVDFTNASFAGVTDASQAISIDGNVQFAAWEDTTPATTAPSEGAFTFGATSATGSITATFTATTNVIYVKYRLVAIPATLLDQSYQAGYTVTGV